MAIRTVQDVIAGEAFAQWRARHQDMQRLQEALAQALAACDIAPDSCCVDRLADSELRLVAVSAAASVRIRQILPTLRNAFNNSGFPVRDIRVSVIKIPD